MIELIMAAVASAWLGSIEWRMRTVSQELKKVPNRKEVHQDIVLHQEALKVSYKDIKEDIQRIEKKLDKLIEKY